MGGTMKRRLAVLAVTTALALGATVGVAAACDEPPVKEKCNNGVGNGPDCRPGKAHFNNDDTIGVPGAPGAFFKIAY
jgi:uncharacterized membrane protein